MTDDESKLVMLHDPSSGCQRPDHGGLRDECDGRHTGKKLTHNNTCMSTLETAWTREERIVSR